MQCNKKKYTRKEACDVLLNEAKQPRKYIEVDGDITEVGKGIICTSYKTLSTSFGWKLTEVKKFIESILPMVEIFAIDHSDKIIIEVKEISKTYKPNAFQVVDNDNICRNTKKMEERKERKHNTKKRIAEPCFKCGKYKFKRISKCSDIQYMEWYYANIKDMDERTKAALEIRIDELEYNIYFK